MKHIFALLLAFIALNAAAQDSTTDYIYSPNGFVLKEGVYSDGFRSYYSIGLYSADGKTLVSAYGTYLSNGSQSNYFYVIAGTEVIASRAFQGMYGATVFIPSSVQAIAPDALPSAVFYNGTASNVTSRFGGIIDTCTENITSHFTPTSDSHADEPAAVEDARFDISGRPLQAPTPGLNIIHFSDGSSSKHLLP